MTTITNNPSSGSGNTQGPGALIIDGRLSDVAPSIADPTRDLQLPVLHLATWGNVASSDELLRAVIAMQSHFEIQDVMASYGSAARSSVARQQGNQAAINDLERIFAGSAPFTGTGGARRYEPGRLISEAGKCTKTLAGSPLIASPPGTRCALDRSVELFRVLEAQFHREPRLTETRDFRTPWFGVRDQRDLGGCVGFAVADLIHRQRAQSFELPSARFIWQGAKELDAEGRPSTMIAGAGTSLRAALHLVRDFGFALEAELPSTNNSLYPGSVDAFYEILESRRVHEVVNLGNDIKTRVAWLSLGLPIVCAIVAGESFLRATGPNATLAPEAPGRQRFIHAVTIMGYRVGAMSRDGEWVTERRALSEIVAEADGHSDSGPRALPVQYLVRNCAGDTWGDRGYAWIDHAQLRERAIESFGVLLPGDWDRIRKQAGPLIEAHAARRS
jgi:hypothetical protein